MKYIFTFLIAFVFTSSVFSQSEVKIGKQIWMTKNLDVSTFRNGDSIPEVRNYADWINAAFNKQPAWCYYNNDIEEGKVYGKHYNWFAVKDPRGLAPEGYRIPTKKDMKILSAFIGKKGGKKLKSEYYWHTNNGDNSTGFNALPGGGFYTGKVASWYTGSAWRGKYADFWTSSEFEKDKSSAYLAALAFNFEYLEIIGWAKGDGFSVRCIRE